METSSLPDSFSQLLNNLLGLIISILVIVTFLSLLLAAGLYIGSNHIFILQANP